MFKDKQTLSITRVSTAGHIYLQRYFAKSLAVRDKSNGLGMATGKLIQLVMEQALSKSTVGYQNERWDWILF